ncbi:hypothetical protein WKT22_00092 [Candidatus Lokiarchaeum ossiferum]
MVLFTYPPITYDDIFWAGGGFFCYLIILHFWEKIWRKMNWKFHQIKVKLLLFRIKKRSTNPRRMAKIQSKITKYIELDYPTYLQIEFILLHGERSPEDMQDDVETYIKHRSNDQNFNYAIQLIERVFPLIEERYDFLYGVFQTILKLEPFFIRIQNVVSFLLKLKKISPDDFNRYNLFQTSKLDEILLEECTSISNYGILFDQLVKYYIETEVKCNKNDLSPQLKMMELQNSNGNMILLQVWQKIVEFQGQFEGVTRKLPIEQFNRVHIALQEQNISDHEQYYFLRENFSTNLQFGFLEYCCLTPEIYEKIHDQITWPEMEEVYHQLFNFPLSNDQVVIL